MGVLYNARGSERSPPQRLLSAQDEKRKVPGKLPPAFSHAYIKRLVPGFCSKGVVVFQNVAELVRPSQGGASGGREGEKWERWGRGPYW